MFYQVKELAWRAFFPPAARDLAETCDTAGILNSAANWAASVQVTEAIKLLVGARRAMRRSLLSFDLWRNDFAEVATRVPDPECRACARHEFIHLAGEGRPQITLCGRNSVQIHERRRPVDFAEMNRGWGHMARFATTTSS